MSILFDVTVPVFAIIGAGFLFGKAGVMDVRTSEALNRYSFYLAFPVALFHGTARVPLAETLNGRFLAAFVLGVLAAFVLAAAGARLLFREGLAQSCIYGAAASYPNTAYMGFPLFIAAYGPDRLGPAIASSVATALVVVAITAIWLESLNGGGGVRGTASLILRSLSRNPLILGSLGGLAWSAVSGGQGLPAMVGTFCSLVGASAGPTALFGIGLFIAARPFRIDAGRTGWIVAVKLVGQPLLTWILLKTVFRGLDPFWEGTAVILAAMPTAGTTFVIAQNYRTGVERSSMAILTTTVASLATLSALMAWYGPLR
jgi:malonate transporter and related proteins